jgi:translocation and assembly module TamB
MDPTGVQWTGGTILAAGNPLRISGRASWGGNLDVRVDGKLPASVVRLAVPSVFDRLDGTVTLDARVTGSWDAPSIVGTGHLEGGTLSFIGYNQLFEGIRADAVISREKIVFEHIEAKSGGGYLDGWGEVPLKMDAGQRLYFSVDFLDVRYPYPEDFRPVVQGHVELIGPMDDLLATGDVEVQSARYTRVLYPEKALVDFSGRLSNVVARREKSDFRVRLDINVVSDRTIRIKNNMADIKAGGEFKVGGDTRKVIILGTFDVYEGYVEYYGTRYELKRATVDFQDPRRINPRLDARAETKKGSYNISVLVTGTMEKPEVDFTSDPPLSRTDIVSLLAFGVTTQSVATSGTGAGTPSGLIGTGAGPSSSALGGTAAIAIGSSVGGVDETIRSTMGLDKFAIETGFSQTTQSMEPRFVVGKSFGDRMSISASQSVGTSIYTSASGELKLWEDVYLQGSWQSRAGATEGEIGGDLKVRYRYRSLKDLLDGKE